MPSTTVSLLVAALSPLCWPHHKVRSDTASEAVMKWFCLDILEHRIKCNVPPGPCASANKVECTPQQDDSVDEVSQSDDNSFAAIISDGESSGSEGEPSDEEDNHSKERALFISEAKKRQTLDQRCMCC